MNDEVRSNGSTMTSASWLAAAVLLGGTCLATHGQAATQPQPGTPPESTPPGVAAAKPGTGAGPPPPYHL